MYVQFRKTTNKQSLLHHHHLRFGDYLTSSAPYMPPNATEQTVAFVMDRSTFNYLYPQLCWNRSLALTLSYTVVQICSTT